jgi:opacity protein-like surface antigen
MGPTVPVTRFAAAILIAVAASGLGHDASCAESTKSSRSHWGTLRLQGMYTWPVGDNSVQAWNQCEDSFLDFLDFYSSINVNNSVGILASFEYVVARHYGFELSFLYWDRVVDLKFEAEDITIEGAPNFILPTLGFNYHFLPGRATDLYAGGAASLGVIATGWGIGDLEISKDVALGLNLGLDYYLDDSWSIGGGLRYMDFGRMDFSVFPPGFKGIVCNNGLFGIGDMAMLSMTVGGGFKF